MQSRQLNNVLRKDRLSRMIDNEALNGADVYTITTMLRDLRSGLWSKLVAIRNIDAYRRDLQRAHVNRLAQLMQDDKKNRSDISAVVRAELSIIQGNARNAAPRYRTGIVRYHLQDIDAMIAEVLDIK